MVTKTRMCQGPHTFKTVSTLRLSTPRDGKNAVRVYECKECGLGMTSMVAVGAAKMKGRR